jgi:hypothetical protein
VRNRQFGKKIWNLSHLKKKKKKKKNPNCLAKFLQQHKPPLAPSPFSLRTFLLRKPLPRKRKNPYYLTGYGPHIEIRGFRCSTRICRPPQHTRFSVNQFLYPISPKSLFVPLGFVSRKLFLSKFRVQLYLKESIFSQFNTSELLFFLSFRFVFWLCFPRRCGIIERTWERKKKQRRQKP